VFVLVALSWRPLRTSCWIVGTARLCLSSPLENRVACLVPRRGRVRAGHSTPVLGRVTGGTSSSPRVAGDGVGSRCPAGWIVREGRGQPDLGGTHDGLGQPRHDDEGYPSPDLRSKSTPSAPAKTVRGSTDRRGSGRPARRER